MRRFLLLTILLVPSAQAQDQDTQRLPRSPANFELWQDDPGLDGKGPAVPYHEDNSNDATYSQTKVLYEKESLYHYILVTESCGIRRLKFQRAGGEYEESVIDVADPLRFGMYHYGVMLATFAHRPTPRAVLFIGLGGGTLSMAIHHYFPQARIDNVELDPEVVFAAKRFFGLKEDGRMRVLTRDGRVQARRLVKQKRRYDVIMVDAFRGGYIPYHLTTREFMETLRALLTEDGIIVTNLRPGFESYHYHRRTLASTFRNQWSYGSGSNVIVVTSMQSPAPTKGALLTAARRLQVEKQFSVEIPDIIKQGGRRNDFLRKGAILTDDFAPTDVLRSIPSDYTL